jgi:hypothetical protein
MLAWIGGAMAFCENCGARLTDGARFCENCGTPVGGVSAGKPVDTRTSAQLPAGSSIALGEDGTYRWVFEYSLWRDPTVFLTVFKVFAGVGLGLVVLTGVFDLFDGNWDIVDLADRLRFDAVILAIACGLALVGYVVFALMQGGKYCVMFTMDEESVEYRPLPKEMKRAEAIGALNVLMGLAAGNATQVGIGLTSAAANAMTSNFANVRSIQGYPRRGVIKVNEPFAKNQVYVEKNDYDFVFGFICDRCPRAKIRG